MEIIHKVDTAMFKYLADKKISSLYAVIHLIKGSSEYKVLINRGNMGYLNPGAKTDAQIHQLFSIETRETPMASRDCFCFNFFDDNVFKSLIFRFICSFKFLVFMFLFGCLAYVK